jgi:AhpD family alkylhydroperoxidase
MNSHFPRTLKSCRQIGSLDPENPSLDEISVDAPLLDLVRLRVAQIYNCPLCTDYHTESLRQHGESRQRIQEVETWRTSTLFDEREQAALALADSLTSEPYGPIPDEVVYQARQHFNEAEILQLVLAVFAASDWNYQAKNDPQEAMERMDSTHSRWRGRPPGE